MSADTNASNLSTDEERALAHVLDEIIPRSEDRRLPSAGELGLVGYLRERAPELAPVIRQGLTALDEIAASRGSKGFSSLSGADRVEVLNELAARDPGFLPGLIFHTYSGYYQNPRVMEALGLEPRPPHPKGYEMEPNDLTLLDAVRQRPKLYREP